MDIALNYSLIAWTAALALLARRNANLGSLLVVMMIPKVFDLVVLTPSLQYLKSGDFRFLFYAIHALNDALMIAVIINRVFVASMINIKAVVRRLAVEKFILLIYGASIIYNLIVVGEFLYLWKDWLGVKSYPFFTYYSEFKNLLEILEAAVLTVLTVQTIKAVRELKRRGLID